MSNTAPRIRSDYPSESAEHSSRLPSRQEHSSSQSLDESDNQDLRRPVSSGSDISSIHSDVTAISHRPNATSSPRPPPRTTSIFAAGDSANSSNVSLTNISQPSVRLMPHNVVGRKSSGRGVPPDLQKHRRQHSQGFFEPTLPTASSSEQALGLNTLSASRIAAQAAMQHQQQTSAPHPQKRPPPLAVHEDSTRSARGASVSPPPLTPTGSGGFAGQSYQNGIVGGHVFTATTAANAAFPRNAGLTPAATMPELPPEKEYKPKAEKSKMKLFSKPKHIGISRDKDGLAKDRGLPSPSKMPSGLSRIVSASTNNLADPPISNNSSMYNLSNASASTIVPADRQPPGEKEKEKEKDKDKDKDKAHKHHFLSRQKLKLKDRDDHYNLPLSSASSNSRPADPSAPQSLYSFTPSSPNPSSTAFGKSVSGLDLLHGGRALREKKKEEKAHADLEQHDWTGSSGGGGLQSGLYGPSSLGSSSGILAETALRETLQGFGLNNMTPEDAWDFLKAKLLVIFDGEDVRIAIEDLNKLVLIHIQRCVHKRAPNAVVNDLRELLETGFASLNHTLNGIPDDKLVPHLVQIWMLVFGTILPFVQAVFLPLDLEFKGLGTILNPREAAEFWKSVSIADNADDPSTSQLDVRTIVLVAFRDILILSRYENLKAIFSRLSLDSINSSVKNISTTARSSNRGDRPSTAASLDPGLGSYSSQSSTLLNTGVGSYSPDSFSNRSRAASNTSSNPDQLIFQSISTPPQRPTIIHRSSPNDSSHVITETVGRMLQCVSVLASVQTADEAQERVEGLSKALKHNWLGRGRTGRDRRGFVGAKIRPPIITRSASDDSTQNMASDGVAGIGVA